MRGRALALGVCVSALGAAVWLGCGSEPAPDVVDASVPSDAKADVSPPDATADACPSVCGTPCPQFVPGALHTLVEGGVCTDQQIEGFRVACFDSLQDGGDGGACTPFRAANAACAACLTTDPNDTAWGALLLMPGTTNYVANVAGCLAKTSADASCAASAENAWACPEYFCTKVCQLPYIEGDGPSNAAHFKCLADARKTFCSAWTNTACTPAEAGPTAACSGSNFTELFSNVARVMCGVADAGGE